MRKNSLLLLPALLLGASTLVGAQPPAAEQPSRSPSDRARTSSAADDNGPDLGWIGLLGLVGLFGLRRRPAEHYEGTRQTATAR